MLREVGADEVARDRADAEDQGVEQALRARADVFGEELVDEDVHRGEEEGVADAVQDVDRDGQGRLGHEGEHGEPRRVAQDADNHGRPPAERLEDVAQERHRADLGDLADAHDRHHPVARDADAGVVPVDPRRAREESLGPHEVSLMHRRVDERHHEQHQDEGVLQQPNRFEPCQAVAAGGIDRFRRRVRQGEAERGEQQRGDARREERVAGRVAERLTLEGVFRVERRLEPVAEADRAERRHRRPVDEDEDERPGGGDPADGAPQPDPAELLAVLEVGEGDGVRDRDGRDVEE